MDEEKLDVLVHFDGWGARFDTWFPMTSALIRGRTQLDEKPEAPVSTLCLILSHDHGLCMLA